MSSIPKEVQFLSLSLTFMFAGGCGPQSWPPCHNDSLCLFPQPATFCSFIDGRICIRPRTVSFISSVSDLPYHVLPTISWPQRVLHLTLPLPLTPTTDIPPSSSSTTTTTTTMPRKAIPTTKPAAKPLLTPAPISAPWTAVLGPTGKPIPYLQQTHVANMTVCKNAQSTPQTKDVHLLLITHSDGGHLIHDTAGFTEAQACRPGNLRYLGLMAQLGKHLAANLGIGSSRGGGNRPGEDAAWDVLVQLPLKYNAFYKSRSLKTGQHLDLYIAGHDGGKFDSVKQFALHLAWLAKDDCDGGGGGCGCKVCKEERRKGFKLEGQVVRKSRWAEHQGPVLEGVPDWRVGDTLCNGRRA